MGMLIKECECCREAFEANPRLGKRQRVCQKAGCRRWRVTDSQRQWRLKNPDYDQGSADRHACDYWSQYRDQHPSYEDRNRTATRARMREQRTLFATQDSIRGNPVGYLEGLRPEGMFATQDAIRISIDGILTYLETPGLFATQDSIDRRADPGE